LTQRDPGLRHGGSRAFPGEKRVERASDATINLRLYPLGFCKALFSNRNRCLGSQRFDPCSLHLSQQVQHPQAVAFRSDPKLGARRTDTCLPLPAAFPRPLIPSGRLRSANRRVRAGSREILDIDTHDIAGPHVGLGDCRLCRSHPRGTRCHNRIAAGDPGKGVG
jgi:hypothetical protein